MQSGDAPDFTSSIITGLPIDDSCRSHVGSPVPLGFPAVAAVDALLLIGAVPSIVAVRSDQRSNQRLPMELMSGASILAVVLAALDVYRDGAHLVAPATPGHARRTRESHPGLVV